MGREEVDSEKERGEKERGEKERGERVGYRSCILMQAN